MIPNGPTNVLWLIFTQKKNASQFKISMKEDCVADILREDFVLLIARFFHIVNIVSAWLRLTFKVMGDLPILSGNLI